MGVLREDAASVAKRLGRLNRMCFRVSSSCRSRTRWPTVPNWTREEDKAVLAALEQYKQEHPGEVIFLEGHCHHDGQQA